MRLAGRVERLERELGDKRGIAVTIAADFLNGGAPSFTRIFDHRGFKLTAAQRPPDEPWAAFVARAKGEAGERPRMPVPSSSVRPSWKTSSTPTKICRSRLNRPRGVPRMSRLSWTCRTGVTADADFGDSDRMAALESHIATPPVWRGQKNLERASASGSSGGKRRKKPPPARASKDQTVFWSAPFDPRDRHGVWAD